MGAQDISIPALFSFLIFLVPVLAISSKLSLNLNKTIIFSAIRMCLQLSFVGIYLEVLFRINSPVLNLAYLLIMLVIACSTVLRSSRLRIRKFFIPLFGAMVIPFSIVLLFFDTAIVPISSLLDARYLIPIGGMLLGNCLRSLVIGLDRFYSGIDKNHKEYLFALSLYNSQFQALVPWARQSIAAAVTPTLASMASIGLVSLPGMMTGQILGGSIPIVAIKYQIAIMAAIFYTEFFSVVLSLLFSLPFGFTPLHVPRRDIFRNNP
jgi:putative ABC transport system permease protein